MLRQKKVSKEKATLLSATLRCATGTLRCSVQPGSRSNSPSAQTIASPDPAGPPLLGADRRGWERIQTANTNSQTPQNALCAFCSPIPISFAPNPSWLGRAAQMEAGSGPQLFEAIAEFCGPPPESSTAGCPVAQRRDPDCGSPCHFLLAKQKKVTSRRATPGLVVKGDRYQFDSYSRKPLLG